MINTADQSQSCGQRRFEVLETLPIIIKHYQHTEQTFCQRV